ncbi:MAG: energy-coupling factor ABC transporter permease [Promethearchaeota archaeon]
MHIGDGLLDLTILIPLWIVVFAYGAYSLMKMRNSLKGELTPIASVLTAAVFAFQMLNFPIAAGTSGHFLGFMLLAILISPSAAFWMMTVVLCIQAFIFADGGILALGANIFNMSIATLPGYFFYWIIRKRMVKPLNNEKSLSKSEVHSTSLKQDDSNNYQDRGLLIGAFVGAYFSITFASLICGLEIGFSSSFPYPISLTVPLMLGYHALIGIGEALITTFVVVFFKKYAPEYIPDIQKIPIWS